MITRQQLATFHYDFHMRTEALWNDLQNTLLGTSTRSSGGAGLRVTTLPTNTPLGPATPRRRGPKRRRRAARAALPGA